MAAALYVLLLLVFHWQLPEIHVWVIASVFSIVMNFPYLIEALSLKANARTEVLVSSFLILLSVLGLFTTPLLIIGAIVGHGFWDLAKHFGKGVPFFFWYTCSCFLVDLVYGLLLLLYFLRHA